MKYQPIKRKRNLKPLYITAGIIFGLALFLCIGYWTRLYYLCDLTYHHYNYGTHDIDLDGDGKTEKITFSKKGTYITVNGKKYIFRSTAPSNKSDEEIHSQDEDNFFSEYIFNNYYILDINNDGLKEIVITSYNDMGNTDASDFYFVSYTNGNFRNLNSGPTPYATNIRYFVVIGSKIFNFNHISQDSKNGKKTILVPFETNLNF